MTISLLLALALAAAAPVEHPRTYLASIAGLNLGSNEYVDSFSIDTWGVTFKAVCHIPPGWRIKAGGSAAPDGQLVGEGTQGATFLGRSDVSKLHALVLLTLYDRVQRSDIGCLNGQSCLPATFKGTATIGTYGGDGPSREARLTYANINLVRADRCPAPRP